MKAVPLNRYIVFFSIAIVGCALDLATKSWAFNRPGMSEGHVEWVCNGVLALRTDVNTGMLFGMGQGMAPVFAALSVVAALGILAWLFYAGAARDRLLTVALGCVMAGILGNLYDRLGMHGEKWSHTNQFHKAGEPIYAVRDWIVVMIGKYEWPAFNIADSLLVCGAVMLVWHAFRTQPQDGPPKAEGDPEKAEV